MEFELLEGVAVWDGVFLYVEDGVFDEGVTVRVVGIVVLVRVEGFVVVRDITVVVGLVGTFAEVWDDVLVGVEGIFDVVVVEVVGTFDAGMLLWFAAALGTICLLA